MNTINRRNFLKIMIAGMASVMAILLGGPLIGNVIEPFYQKKSRSFTKVPGFKSIPENQVTSLNMEVLEKDSFFKQDQTQQVWVIKHAPDRATVYSPICTHLACQVNWQGDWQKFVCPCHGSVFNADGRVVSGPAPRGLDTLAYKIEGDELYVQWNVFKAGIAQQQEI